MVNKENITKKNPSHYYEERNSGYEGWILTFLIITNMWQQQLTEVAYLEFALCKYGEVRQKEVKGKHKQVTVGPPTDPGLSLQFEAQK